MRVRTYLGILLGLLVVVTAAILTQLNKDLLVASFRITQDTEVPFYALLLGVFLTAFLPTATLLLVQSVRRGFGDPAFPAGRSGGGQPRPGLSAGGGCPDGWAVG